MTAVAAEVPSDETLLRVSVEAIECFDGNPRLIANPEYERIKASIRGSGLQQPLVITQVPGADHYTVEAGGNTRLQILKQLYSETGEARFGEIDCVLRPWVSYDHVVIAHLKENDLRGNLTFIEKSLAICAIESRLNEEASHRRTKPIPQRAVAERLDREGFAVDQSQLSAMRYAVERLYPVMANALKAGMGRPSIRTLQRLDGVAAQLWSAWGLEEEGDYNEAFLALCERYGEALDFEAFSNDLYHEIAHSAEVSRETVKLVLADMLDGEPAPPRPKPGDFPDSVENAGEEGEGGQLETGDEESGQEDEKDPTSFHAHGDFAGPGLESLRANAYQTAFSLAEPFGLEALIEATPEFGTGYLVIDFPDRELMDHCELEERAVMSFLWWHLVALSELTVMPVDQVQAVLPPESKFRAALESSQETALLEGIWTLDPGQAAHRFWNVLDAEQWGLLVDLQEIYRTLRSCFSPAEPLWRLQS